MDVEAFFVLFLEELGADFFLGSDGGLEDLVAAWVVDEWVDASDSCFA